MRTRAAAESIRAAAWRAEYVDSVEDVMTREHPIWLTKRATPGIPR